MTGSSLQVCIRQMRLEAERVLSLELESADGATLPDAGPGSHIDLELGNDLRRAYSLTRAAHGDASYSIAVQRDPESRGGSTHVHERLRVGETLVISRPRNNFPLTEGAAESVFIAGGIGITPILSMIRHLTATQQQWHLYYAARSRGAAAFVEEIEDCARRSGGSGHATFHFDDIKNGALIEVSAIVKQHDGAHFYCCGPEPMMTAFNNAASHLPSERRHLEYFSSAAEAARDRGFDLILQRSDRVLRVDKGQTILDVLVAAKVNVAFSCCEGICGTCETRVLEGEPDHRDMILTESERAENKTMMVCCSGSKSARLVLDL